MKKLVGIAVFAAALVIGAVAQAASINIIATQQSAGSNTWVLSLDTASLPVAAIGIVAPDSATFVINSSNTAIASMGGGSSYGAGATPGLFSLNLNPSTCAGINCTPFTTGPSTILGTFTSVDASTFSIAADDGSVGGTAFDAQLNAYAEAQIDVHAVPFPVPEPATAVMLGLGLAALGAVRRKAA